MESEMEEMDVGEEELMWFLRRLIRETEKGCRERNHLSAI